MNRSEKAEFIGEVRSLLDGSPFLVLTDFQGATVLELDRFRRGVESSGATFRVVKNSLCRIALADTAKAALVERFRGNVGVVVSGEDAVATAKAFRALVKENDKIKVRAGFFDGDVLDAKQVDAVADLPSREELLGQLLATLEEAPRQVLRLLQAPARDLISVLHNYSAKLEQAGE
ncbi:MAG TPA: 50S ribosomal protein L10 [Myxococcota bacterium]|nr:50S ribosomal protein L10 [Myxococcota bacterium]